MAIIREILIIEDDPQDCRDLIQAIENACDNVHFLGNTNNSEKALQMVAELQPDAIVLDLELHKGGGDGLDFLKKLKSLDISYKPFIVVATNNVSRYVHDAAREHGADFIMTKSQENYSAEQVIDFIISTLSNPNLHKAAPEGEYQESATQYSKRIERKIINELNLIGMKTSTLGYGYLTMAIKMILKSQVTGLPMVIAKQVNKSPSSVERAMQNAIDRTWVNTDTDTLFKDYTATIHSDRGVPTITEFVYYYANKIKSE